jgi:hypothetical protein
MVATLNEGDNLSFKTYLVLLKFNDVFPNELSRLLPKLEINFSIELRPSIEPVSKD